MKLELKQSKRMEDTDQMFPVNLIKFPTFSDVLVILLKEQFLEPSVWPTCSSVKMHGSPSPTLFSPKPMNVPKSLEDLGVKIRRLTDPS